MSKMVQWLQTLADGKCEDVMTRISGEFFCLPGRPPITESRHFLHSLRSKVNKNRYRDVPCLDVTRVHLKSCADDYIHANWVRLPGLDCDYILTQAPLESTTVDFWEMVWQEESEIIVCLTQVVEKNRKKTIEYWPMDETPQDKPGRKYGRFRVRNKMKKDKNSVVISLLEVSNTETDEKRAVIHYLYLDWPDHKVPVCTHEFLKLLDMLNREINAMCRPPASIVVHCSAGIGRSGTLVALQAVIKEINRDETPDIAAVVRAIRQQRALGVQAIEQYVFLYRAAISYSLSYTKMSVEEAHQIYEQLDWMRESTTRSTCKLEERAMSLRVTARSSSGRPITPLREQYKGEFLAIVYPKSQRLKDQKAGRRGKLGEH